MAEARDTRRKILKVAAELLGSGGLGKLTFDAVAKRVGVSKQAVIYWFPKKEDLIGAVAVPAMRQEAEAALSAMKATPNEAEAIRSFVRTVAEFHFADLNRFRLMYVAPQVGPNPGLRLAEDAAGQIHALTSSIYDELQARLMKGGGMAAIEARRAAVAVDMAVLGLVMMVAVTDAMGDPLLHNRHDMVEAMANLLAGAVP
jgi:AcrR family transcriptional regulator